MPTDAKKAVTEFHKASMGGYSIEVDHHTHKTPKEQEMDLIAELRNQLNRQNGHGTVWVRDLQPRYPDLHWRREIDILKAYPDTFRLIECVGAKGNKAYTVQLL